MCSASSSSKPQHGKQQGKQQEFLSLDSNSGSSKLKGVVGFLF
jgi:hypothetical protein